MQLFLYYYYFFSSLVGCYCYGSFLWQKFYVEFDDFSLLLQTAIITEPLICRKFVIYSCILLAPGVPWFKSNTNDCYCFVYVFHVKKVIKTASEIKCFAAIRITNEWVKRYYTIEEARVLATISNQVIFIFIFLLIFF